MTALFEFLTKFFRDNAPPTATPALLFDNHKRGTVAHVAIRDGYKLVELAPAPSQVPSRRHTFDDVPSFAYFLLRHFQPSSAEIFARPEGIHAASTAAWERDEVMCSLAPDPSFTAWSGACGRYVGQRDLYVFLSSHKEDMAGEPAEKVLAALRQLSVHKDGEYVLNLTERGSIEYVSSSAKTEVRGIMPPNFKVSVPVYFGQPECFELDIEVVPDLDRTPPLFMLRCRNLDRVRQAAFEGEVRKLRGLLAIDPAAGPEYLVSFGKALFQ